MNKKTMSLKRKLPLAFISVLLLMFAAVFEMRRTSC